MFLINCKIWRSDINQNIPHLYFFLINNLNKCLPVAGNFMYEENALQTHSFRGVADAMREYARSISYYCNNGWWRVYAPLSWFVKFALKTLGRAINRGLLHPLKA